MHHDPWPSLTVTTGRLLRGRVLPGRVGGSAHRAPLFAPRFFPRCMGLSSTLPANATAPCEGTTRAAIPRRTRVLFFPLCIRWGVGQRAPRSGSVRSSTGSWTLHSGGLDFRSSYCFRTKIRFFLRKSAGRPLFLVDREGSVVLVGRSDARHDMDTGRRTPARFNPTAPATPVGRRGARREVQGDDQWVHLLPSIPISVRSTFSVA